MNQETLTIGPERKILENVRGVKMTQSSKYSMIHSSGQEEGKACVYDILISKEIRWKHVSCKLHDAAACAMSHPIPSHLMSFHHMSYHRILSQLISLRKQWHREMSLWLFWRCVVSRNSTKICIQTS
jgi:hypothetical protein